MDETISELANHLTRYYFLSKADASLMIDDEFVFVEKCLDAPNVKIEDIAKALIDIYMVA